MSFKYSINPIAGDASKRLSTSLHSIHSAQEPQENIPILIDSCVQCWLSFKLRIIHLCSTCHILPSCSPIFALPPVVDKHCIYTAGPGGSSLPSQNLKLSSHPRLSLPLSSHHTIPIPRRNRTLQTHPVLHLHSAHITGQPSTVMTPKHLVYRRI